MFGKRPVEAPPPYVYLSGEEFPFPVRIIRMGGIVANDNVARAVFTHDELTWIDGATGALLGDPSKWAEGWMTLIALRSAGLKVKHSRTTTKDRRGRVTTSSGYDYNSFFLARYSVHHSLIAHCLQAGNRPLLAQQLQARPYEAELLRNDNYTKSVISGVLAESGSMASPINVPSAWVICGFCKTRYQRGEGRCPHCGAHHTG